MSPHNIFFVSLGCSKNLVDTEVMMGLLRNSSFEITDKYQEADLIVINTCGFVEKAKKESIETILQYAELKETGKLEKLVVAGCLAQRYKKDLLKEIPEVDLFIGTKEFGKIAKLCESLLKNENDLLLGDEPSSGSFLYDHNISREITTGNSAYIKIAEGCDNHCSYCAIPLIRGPFQSRNMESVVKEAESLARSGIVEVNLLAQDITNYGKDLASPSLLPELLRRLNDIPKLSWIRILYAHPEGISKDIIEAIAQNEKVCPYVDIPIQHSHPDMLRSMNRRASVGLIKPLIEELRQKIPDVVLRTTLLVGCPGEEEEHFRHLTEFVKWAGFDRLGVFEYSLEEDTAMGKLGDTVAEETKTKRKNTIIEIQSDISFQKNQTFVNSTQDVFIEEIESGECLRGRTKYHAPEVDGNVFVKTENLTDEEISGLIGKIIPVKIVEADVYDLIGTPVK